MRPFPILIFTILLYLTTSPAGLGQAQYGSRGATATDAMKYRLQDARIVRQDSAGRVYTMFNSGRRNPWIMFGTPYLTFPTWQPGSVQLTDDSPMMPCSIAYDVLSNRVLCRFNQDTTTYVLKPVAFTIEGRPFARLSDKGYPFYYQVLHKGDAQLFEGYKRKAKMVRPQSYDTSDALLVGYLLGMERYYYLKLPNAPMRTFQLTRRSFMHAMGDNVDTRLLPPGDTLSVADVVRVLADYDTHE